MPYECKWTTNISIINIWTTLFFQKIKFVIQHIVWVKETLSNSFGQNYNDYWWLMMVNTEIRLVIFFAAKDGEALYSQRKTRLGADCRSDNELLIAKFRLKLKKAGKTTRPFRYDPNQIPLLLCSGSKE